MAALAVSDAVSESFFQISPEIRKSIMRWFKADLPLKAFLRHLTKNPKPDLKQDSHGEMLIVDLTQIKNQITKKVRQHPQISSSRAAASPGTANRVIKVVVTDGDVTDSSGDERAPHCNRHVRKHIHEIHEFVAAGARKAIGKNFRGVRKCGRRSWAMEIRDSRVK